MKKDIKFSIIMTCYNESNRRLGFAIESLLSQSYKEFELIIVDDNSTDQSIEIIKKYQNDNRIMILRNSTNKGSAASLNKGLRYASGDFIVINDADDISIVNRLDIINDFLTEKTIDIIGSSFYQIKVKDGEHVKTTYYNDYKFKRIGMSRLLIGPPFAHSTTFYRRSSLIQIGGFDENLSSSIDHFCMIKLVNSGFVLTRVGIPLVFRFIDGSNFFMGENPRVRVRESKDYIEEWCKKNIGFYFIIKIPMKLYTYLSKTKIYSNKYLNIVKEKMR